MTTKISRFGFGGGGGSSGSVPTGTGYRHVTNGAEDGTASVPTTAAVADTVNKRYVTDAQLALIGVVPSPTAREFHVGSACEYTTIDGAITAINALAPGLDWNHRAIIVLHEAYYEWTTPKTVPGLVTVKGVSKGSVTLYNGTSDMFVSGGPDIYFEDFLVEGSASTGAVFNLNGKSRQHIRNVDMLGGGGADTQKFITQSGNSWGTLFIEHCVLNSYRTSGYLIELLNTSGTCRYIDTEINDVFSDTYSMSATGGSFLLEAVQDVRFRGCRVRGTPGTRCIYLDRAAAGGTAWMELQGSAFCKGDDVGNAPYAFVSTAGTAVRLANCDAPTYTAGGTCEVIGAGVPGPAGPQGNPGIQGPGGPAVGLTTAYDIDLSTLPNQSFSSDGLKTIDSRAAWNLVNSNHGQLIALNDGTHAGLYTRCSAFASANYAGTYNCPRWVVGLNDLCGVNPRDSVEQWVMFMHSQPHTPNANYEYAYFGVGIMPGAEIDTNHTYPVFELMRGYTDSLKVAVEWQKTTVTQNPSGVVLPATTRDVYAFRIVGNNEVQAYAGSSVGGAWPDISALVFVARAFFAPPQGLSAEFSGNSNLFQWAAVINVASSNTAGASDVLLKKIKVLYR